MATQIPEGWYDAVAVPFDKHFCSIDCEDPGCEHEMVAETSYGHIDVIPNDRRTPYIEMTFQITSGEYTGQKRRWKGWLTQNAAPYTAEKLYICGYQGSMAQLTKDIHNQTLDQPVRIEIEHQSGSDGKIYEQVKKVSGGGRARRATLGRKNRHQVHAELNALMSQHSGPATASKAPAKPNLDDDLPF